MANIWETTLTTIWSYIKHKILKPNSHTKLQEIHGKFQFASISRHLLVCLSMSSVFLFLDKLLAKYDDLIIFSDFLSTQPPSQPHNHSSPNARCQSGKSLLRGRRHTGERGHEFGTISESKISGSVPLKSFHFPPLSCWRQACFQSVHGLLLSTVHICNLN